MGFIFMALFSGSITPFIMFLVLYAHVTPDRDETIEQAQTYLRYALVRSGWFWTWVIYTGLLLTFVIIAYSK